MSTDLKSPRCWLWHDWSRWTDGVHAVETFHFGSRIPVIIQERRCAHCNALEQRTVRP